MWFDGMGSCIAQEFIQQAKENIQQAIYYTKLDTYTEEEVDKLKIILKMLNKEA